MMKKRNNKMQEMNFQRITKNFRFREETRNRTNEETNHMKL